MRRPATELSIVLFLTLPLLGCRESSDRSGSSAEEAIVFLVAASAKDAVEEAVAQFERTTGHRVNVVPGPSSTLAQQIAAGSPANLFLAASENWVDVVTEAGLCELATPLLTNDLVIVVPKRNPANVQTASDLASDRVQRVALAGENAPAGIYAQQALESHGLYRQLEDDKKIVRGGDVRIALGYVERGEAEAGIVYSTDAMISVDVEVVFRFDPADHEQIVYPLVLLKSNPPHEQARKLYDFLRSADALSAFERHGFKRPYHE